MRGRLLATRAAAGDGGAASQVHRLFGDNRVVCQHGTELPLTEVRLDAAFAWPPARDTMPIQA